MVAVLRGSARVRGWRLTVLVLVLVATSGGHPVSGQTGSIPILLVPGWNNFAYGGSAQPVQAALAAIAGKYDALAQFDGVTQSWRSFKPRSPEISDFNDMTQGAAYWIHMTEGALLTISVVGTVPNQNRALSLGLNNVGQIGPTAPVPDALALYQVTFGSVWHWNAAAQRWELYDPSAPQVSDFQILQQGQAYFVQVVAAAPGAVGPSASCYGFQSYQPQYLEVLEALNRAGLNVLADDPSFRLADLHTATDGGAATTPAYIPPTVLKSIAWIESGWRQATFSVERGRRGATITSRTCAYGLLQVLTGMTINGSPTDRQNLIGTDYLRNVAAGAQILVSKWNMAPRSLPIFGRRDPHIIEDWYFALWAYHCYGDVCARYDVHDNPDDPVLKWPRPVYGSPEQQGSHGAFTVSDYPYQEIIFGQIAFPPSREGTPLWQAIPVLPPPHGTVGFPTPKDTIEASAHLENGQALAVPTPVPTPSPTPAPAVTPGPGRTPTPVPLNTGADLPASGRIGN